ncbi:MAG: flagellar basal body P-ring formation protein FlgA [Synergistaceae bacterium]|nr:flagellar basal body P-ring formation protein FlgA [Synergistaceae bacterium]
MNKFLRQGCLVVMLLLCCMLEAQAAQSIKIEIPEVIYANGDSFTLGQIARITGGKLRTRNALTEIQVFADVDRGRLSRTEVLRAIEESGASDARIELYMPAFSRIEAPDFEGNFTETSAPQVRTAQSLAPIIKALASWNGDVEVSAGSPVPDGELVDPASIVPGTAAATLRFRDNTGRVRSLGVRLTWTQNVVIASRNIKKGDRITAGNLIVRPMKITRPGAYASNVSEIAGFIADRNIKQGEPVLLRNLTSSSIVKRGRQVRIIARLGGVNVSADGILMEDGRPGDWVKVRRADDKRVTLRARIINENTVEVQVE